MKNRNNGCLGIYVRVSTKSQVDEGYSLNIQEEMGIEYAKSMNMSYDVFMDSGLSAANDDIEKRPGLKKLLTSVATGDLTQIYAIDYDRLSRNEFVSLWIKNSLKKYGVCLKTEKAFYDFSDTNDEMLSSMQAIFAIQENATRLKRIKHGIAKSAELGKWHGGIPPFGYDVLKSEDREKNNTLILNHDESEVYNKMVQLSLQNYGGTRIARYLNEKGIQTKGQKIYKNGYNRYNPILKKSIHTPNSEIKWVSKTVLGILKNPLYKGVMTFKGHKHQVPAHISESEWWALQDNFKKNTIHNQKNNKKHFYLLKNLLVCRKCNRRMVGLIKPNRGMRLYQCISKKPNPEPRHCGLKNINLDKLNGIIWNDLESILINPEDVASEVTQYMERKYSDVKRIREAIRRYESRIESKKIEKGRILSLFGRSTSFSIDELDSKTTSIQKSIERMCYSLKRLKSSLKVYLHEKESSSRMRSNFNIYKRTIKKLSDDQKAILCRKFIEKVIVDWDEELGHSIEIFYQFPFPQVPEKQSDHVEDLLESTSHQDEGSFAFSRMVNQDINI